MKFGPFASCGATLFVALALAVAAAPGSAQTQTQAPAATQTQAQAPPPPAARANPPAASPSAPEEASLQPIAVAARPAMVLHSAANWEEGYAKIRECSKNCAPPRKRRVSRSMAPAWPPSPKPTTPASNLTRCCRWKPPRPPSPISPTALTLGASPWARRSNSTHTGSYDDIDTTYDAITAYLDEKGLDATNVFSRTIWPKARTPATRSSRPTSTSS